LPKEYKKFWAEWKYQQPAAVHYIEKKGSYERNEETGEVYDIYTYIVIKYFLWNI